MESIKKEINKITENFSSDFGREFKDDNFFLKDDKYFASFKELEKMWDIKVIEPKKPNIINQKKLVDINDKIYKYYDQVLKKYNYSSTNREDFKEIIKKIFLLLCNIYDLFPNFLEIYFKNDWLNLHFKLIDACLDINNPPEPGLGSNGKEKIYILSYFCLFFSLCLSTDKDFNTRLYLIIKYPDFFYKMAIITANDACFCCCGHGMSNDGSLLSGDIKAILLVFETFKYVEDNNINYEAINNTKLRIVQFFFPHIGKNPCIVYLYKMTKMLKNDDIFNCILNTTNLFQEAFSEENKHKSDFSHAIDGFESFIVLCTNPEYLFKMLNIISSPEKGLKSRIYREILKVISNIISNNNQIEYLENKLFNDNIFQKILDTLKRDVYLGDYEGIWQALLDTNNSNIVTIFYRMKNKYNVGEIMFNQVDTLIKEYLINIRLNAVVRIMNLFLKMGNEIKKKFNVDNYYIEQFKGCYTKINGVQIYNDEDVVEFKSYYQIN